MDIQSLITLLSENNVDPSPFGQGEAKTLAHLLKEVEEGETVFEVEGGVLRRVISLVSIQIQSPFEETLVEDRQVFVDGRVRERGLTALAEKFKPGEDPLKAARRALQEELGLSAEIAESLAFLEGGTEEKVKTSPSYPGLISVYRVTNLSVELPVVAYDPNGYIERQPDKSTYFLWK